MSVTVRLSYGMHAQASDTLHVWFRKRYGLNVRDAQHCVCVLAPKSHITSCIRDKLVSSNA